MNLLSASGSNLQACLVEGGEADKPICSFDWSQTPLGPIETWPQSLRTAVDIMSGADFAVSIYWGADNLLLYNEAWRKLFGVKHSHALGRPAGEVLPQIWSIIGPILGRIRTDGKTAQVQNQPLLLPRNGHPQEFRVTFDFTPLPCEEGSIGGIFNVCAETTEQLHDITERKGHGSMQTENEQRKSFLLHLSDTLRPLSDSSQIEAVASRVLAEHLNAARCYYGAIYENAGQCVIQRDYGREGVSSVAGTHRISEPSFLFDELRTGRPLVISDTASAELSEEDRSELEVLALTAFIAIPLSKQGRLTGVFVVSEKRPRVWSSAEVSLAEEAAERILTAIERALAGEALRRSEERFRALTMASSEVLYRMNPDWSEMRQLYSRQFLANTLEPNRAWLQEYIHPDDQVQVAAAIEDAVRTKSIFELEHRVRQADGSWGWTISRAVPLLDAEGRIVEWFGAASDITARKQAEEALREAKAAAEEASRAKSEFLATVSHEIRTPMTVFMGSIQHLLHKERNPEDHHLLEMADQSAERLRLLIEDILDFSRIEARAVTLEEEAFDLRSCLHRAVAMFILPAGEKNLRLDTNVAPDVPEVVIGDCNKLSQVLINLIGNAVKFTAAGSVRVSVTARDGLLEFRVIDSGIGIPPDKHDLLFQSFSQIKSSSDRNYGGTGLGLAISRELVELMGGEISVSARAEGGSIFTFTLPLQTSARQLSD